jgi:hypothetical protein
MRKVTITERRVYYKVEEIIVDVPDSIPREDIDDWLLGNDSWETELDRKFNDENLDMGLGLDECDGMNEPESSAETRFDVENEQYGGHL